MADDLLSSLVSGEPQSADKIRAIVAQLRGSKQMSQLAQLSGDPTLAAFGQHMQQQDQQNEVELGRNAVQNRSEDIRTWQLNRQLEQGQGTLAETIRYHNMEDQERKDRLAAQKEKQDGMQVNQSTVDKIARYELPYPSRYSKNGQQLIDMLSEQHPEYDATKYDEKKKAQVSFGSGPDSNLVKGADVAIQHLDTADELGKGLHTGKYPAVNAVVNWWKTQTGKPEIAKFNAAKSIVSDEINKFIIGGGGALADREQLQKQLDAANSPEALQGVTSTLRTLMGGQLKGLQSKFVNAGLGDEQDFLKRLAPHTVNSLGFSLPQSSPLAGALGAAGGTPGMGSGPQQGPAPSGPSALPQATQSGAPGAAPGSISPIEAKLRQATGFQGNGQTAPTTATVDNNGIVRTGRRNGKRVGQLADGTIVPLE